MKVYLAGSISGESYEDVVIRINRKRIALEEMGYEVLNPMTSKKAIRTEIKLKSNGYGNPESTNHAIFGRDRWMVEQADILLVDLRGTPERVSIGSCFEMAWGFMLNKHIVLVMEDDSIHKHAFVLEGADIVFETMAEAYIYLDNLAKMR